MTDHRCSACRALDAFKRANSSRVFKSALIGALLAACGGDGEPPVSPLVQDTVTHPRLLLPWSDIKGRIVVHYITENTVVRETLLIDGVRREVRVLGDFGRYIDNMALAPDGSELAFDYVYHDYSRAVNVVSTHDDIGNVWSITNANVVHGYAPAYKRDGLLSYWRGDTLLTRNSPTAVLQGYKLDEHSWAADGLRFTLSIRQGSGLFGVYRFDIGEDSAQSILSSTQTHWSAPAYAPSSRLLAVKQSTGPQMDFHVGDIWIANDDGTNGRLLHSPAVSAFAWSPDGTELVVAGGAWIPNERNPGPVWNGPFPMEQQGVFLLRAADGAFRKLMNANAVLVSWSR